MFLTDEVKGTRISLDRTGILTSSYSSGFGVVAGSRGEQRHRLRVICIALRLLGADRMAQGVSNWMLEIEM